MITGRPLLLKPKEEAQLREELEIAITEMGNTAREIAKGLEFGKKGTVYEKLKLFHVYYYANRFGIKKPKPEKKQIYASVPAVHAPWLPNTEEF